MSYLLYDSRIDWNSLKQRPQYLAECLTEYFDVVYTCTRLYKRGVINPNANKKLVIKHFNYVPLLYRNKFTSKINNALQSLFYKTNLRRYKPVSVIISDAKKINNIKKWFNGPIIYDCMDDHSALNTKQKDEILDYERFAVTESSYTIVSSSHLYELMISRYGKKIEEKLVLIRNGCNCSDLPEYIQDADDSCSFTLCYFGTIGTWFDFDMIQNSLNDFPNLEYLIIGNARPGITMPNNPRIHYLEAVPHDQLAEKTRKCNAFVMPFVVNDIVLSVDPVKLYEYISLGKDILCVDYPEIRRFSEFIYAYNDYNSYKNQLENIMKTSIRKYSRRQKEKFLEENSWHSRVSQIVNIVEKLL